MPGVPTRLRWALDVVDPRSDQRLLEIGCGPGVLAGLVCDRLTTGHLLAIDRSATAISRASQRNERHVMSGRLTFEQCDLSTLTVSRDSLDQAFAVDVNLFWTGPAAAELDRLSHAVRPGGSLQLLYGVGPGDAERVTGRIAAALDTADFHDVVVLDTPAGFGVTARRR